MSQDCSFRNPDAAREGCRGCERTGRHRSDSMTLSAICNPTANLRKRCELFEAVPAFWRRALARSGRMKCSTGAMLNSRLATTERLQREEQYPHIDRRQSTARCPGRQWSSGAPGAGRRQGQAPGPPRLRPRQACRLPPATARRCGCALRRAHSALTFRGRGPPRAATAASPR